MATCLDLVREQIKDLTEKELDEVLEQMRAKQGRLILDGADPATAAAQAGMDLANTLRAAASIERRNAAINLRIRTEALDYLRSTWSDDPTEGVLALLYGSPKARFGSRSSANAAQDAQFRRLMGGVAGELEAKGLFDPLRRGEMDRDVARAMWHLDNPEQFAKLPQQAQDIATTLRKWQEVARIEANRHGAWIGKEPHYVVRQSHHPDRLASAGFERWKTDIKPQLDLARMFPDGPPKNLDDWLHETWLNLTTGVRIKDDVSGERMAAFKGPGNLAKKVSQERVLHFTSPEGWFDYNTQYGFGNIREAYVQGLHRSAESTGLMQVLGTNPEANLDSIITAMRAELSRKDPEKLKAFDRSRGRFQNAYKEVSGFTRQVVSQRMATVGAGLRAFNTLTGLGGAVVSSVTDIPVRASALRFQGQSYFSELTKGLVAPIKRIVSGVGTDERKATLSALGYFNEVAMGNLASRFSPDENLPGRIQKATHTFFKWNLLGAWTDEMRRSSLESMGHFFGGLSDREFTQLSERTRRTLERFKIGEAEWAAIRGGLVEESNGQKFLTPEAVRQIDRSAFTSLSKDRINAVKEGLVERYKKRQAMDAREREWRDRRAEKLRDDLVAASARLSKRIESIEGRGSDELRSLQKKLSSLYDHLDTSRDYWDSIDGRRPIGQLRRAGVTEGKAIESSKALKAEARQIGRDLVRLKKELNEDFIERWAERQDELVDFSERGQARIKQRAEETARDLMGLDPKINRILEDTREDMAARLQTLYADEVNSAAISPDARSLATLRQGSQAGTIVGEGLRLFWQFKSFGIAIMQRGLLREFYGYGKGAGGKLGMSEVRGLATFMAGSIGFGYLAMTLKDLLRGKEPKPLDNPKTWMAAAAQGGGFGIYGDFLFGEANRFGGGFVQTLGGPTIGKAEEIYSLWNATKRGDDTGAQALKFAYRNTPYLNLFYLRMATDYLFLYEMQEAMNPGYLRRMEKRTKEQSGQEWWLKPSEVVN